MTDRADRTQPEAPPPAAPWAPPGAAPFGVPAQAAVPAAERPVGYPPHTGYAPPVGYAAPVGYAPSPGHASSAPTSLAPASVFPPPPAVARRSSALGVVALALGLLAAVGASIVGAAAAFNIGLGTGRELSVRAFGADFDWSILTPVRDWVLLGEVSFWAGTVAGIAAIVIGIVAIVTRRGRGAGIAAVAIAAAGPIVFGAVVQGFLTAGFAAGSGVG